MKAKVTAKISNSPKMPIETFLAEETIDFPEDENVFGRAFRFREHFKNKYGKNIELDLVSVKWM